MWRGIGAPTWLGYGVWMAPVAYGWRLWRAGCAYGVWLAPMAYGWRLWRMDGACGVQGADRVDGLQRVAVVYVSCLCVVMVAPICRHGCVAMACGYPLGLRSIGYGSKA